MGKPLTVLLVILLLALAVAATAFGMADIYRREAVMLIDAVWTADGEGATDWRWEQAQRYLWLANRLAPFDPRILSDLGQLYELRHGEAPGPEENRQGKPFVGRSGKLLDQILEAVHFDPEKDVFITNSVFRMPPGDGDKAFRKPTTEEIEEYKPYLLEIIRLIDPLIMLLSGNVATQSLLGRTGITRLRGEWFDYNGRPTMPIFHPAYLLRNPTREPGGPKALTWRDIREVRRKYDELQSGG